MKTIGEIITALTETERSERSARGLPPDHVLDLSEFPFRYAAKGFNRFIALVIQDAETHPDDAIKVGFAAQAAVLGGDYARADRYLERYSILKPLKNHGVMRFSRPIDKPRATLPPVRGAWPSKPSLFISCDPVYLASYGTALLRSVAECAPGADVHLHIMGTADVPRIEDLTLTHTTEDVPTDIPSLEYYGAARLVRFTQALEAGNVPLIMIDADGLATDDHRNLLKSGELGVRVRAGRIEPWHHFSACAVRGGPQSLGYFKAVSDIVLRALDKPFWGLDQYAMFAAYLQERPDIALFGPDIASVVDNVPGLFWFTAGVRKQNLMTSNTPYAHLFRRYAAESGDDSILYS